MKKSFNLLIALLIVMLSSVFFNIKITGYFTAPPKEISTSSIFLEKEGKILHITVIPGEEGYSTIIQIKNLNIEDNLATISIDECSSICEDILKVNYDASNLNDGSYKLLIFDIASEEFIEKSFRII